MQMFLSITVVGTLVAQTLEMALYSHRVEPFTRQQVVDLK
jgi:hypothetical protein